MKKILCFFGIHNWDSHTEGWSAFCTRCRVEDVFQCEVLRPPVAPSQVVAADITQDQINELWARLDRLEGK